MTSKEKQKAIDALKTSAPVIAVTQEEFNDYIQTLNKIMDWLEQEPCDDAISREDALMCLTGEIKETDTIETIIARVVRRIRKLPPVNPQPKTGHWITWKEAGKYIPSETKFECSVCHDAAQTLYNGLDLLSSYCPNCGAKMIELQESEDKE